MEVTGDKGNESHAEAPIALRIAGLKQVVETPGAADTFTLYVRHSLEVRKGDFVGILGQTGCGKTTLLTVLGLLREATQGSEIGHFEMLFKDELVDLSPIWRDNRAGEANRLRRRHLGFALQHGELLPSLTVAENIAFPLHLNGWPRARIKERVCYLINAFRLYRTFGEEKNEEGTPRKSVDKDSGNLSSLAGARLNHLSGGQYQRVALARAVAHQPEFLFVDEPTASLNRSVARVALQQLASLESEGGHRSTVFMVTHDELFAKEFCNHIIQMRPVANCKPPAGEVIFE